MALEPPSSIPHSLGPGQIQTDKLLQTKFVMLYTKFVIWWILDKLCQQGFCRQTLSAHTSPADPGNHDRQTATDKLCLQKICQKLGQNADKKNQTKLANTEDCRKLRKVADKVCVPQLDKVCLSLTNFVCTSKSWNWRCDHAAKTRGRFSNPNGR